MTGKPGFKPDLIQQLAAVFAAALLFLLLAGCGYQAVDTAAAMKADKQVRVQPDPCGTFFDGPGEADALIFYPGAQVQETAYAPLLRRLSAAGVDCFAVKMPLGFAFFGIERAQKLMARYDYARWFLAGHSLGGAMAAEFAAKHGDALSGLILLGAYSAKDLSKASFPMLYLYGSRDEILTRKKLEQSLQMSPVNTRIVEITGGNHAFFGSYGEQKGDGRAAIPSNQQQEKTANEILKMIRG